MPSAPDWEKKPARPGPGSDGAKVALSRTAAVGVHDAQAVRSDHPHAVRPRLRHQLPLGWPAPCPRR